MSSQRLLASRHSTTQQHVVTSGRPHAVLLSGAVLMALLLMLSGCHRTRSAQAVTAGDTIPLRYAQNLTMVRFSDGILVELKDPWHEGRILHRYWLTEDSNSKRSSLHTSLSSLHSPLSSIKFPLQRSVVFNTAHASLIGMLNATDHIAGVADLKYMLLPDVQRRVQQGEIVDCGNSMSPDIEQIVSLHADAILLSPFENSGGYGRLEKLGIPIIECADYMETSPLGRAEWMRFYGLLFGCSQQADSLFSMVERAYCTLRDSVASTSQRLNSSTSLLTERLTGSTWYVPGGKSTMGRLIADAGATYAWADDDHSGSLALSFETVLSKSGNADVWLMNTSSPQPFTYESLAAEHHGYTQFKAFRNRNIYFINTLQVPYFEEVSFRPDLLLRDYITMLHPNSQHPPLRYFQKMQTQ
ncbi:MAG: ABC transporter substrate-binding protein [Prevotella sp.]|nr:ABC transporter substrate-binding protein [Prevotella sp.]